MGNKKNEQRPSTKQLLKYIAEKTIQRKFFGGNATHGCKWWLPSPLTHYILLFAAAAKKFVCFSFCL